MVLWKVKWSSKLLQFILRGTLMSVRNEWQSIQQWSRHFTEIQKCKPHGDACQVRGSSKSVAFILWLPWRSVPNFMTIKLIAVEVFQSGPKWWTIQCQHYIPRAMHVFFLKGEDMVIWMQSCYSRNREDWFTSTAKLHFPAAPGPVSLSRLTSQVSKSNSSGTRQKGGKLIT